MMTAAMNQTELKGCLFVIDCGCVAAATLSPLQVVHHSLLVAHHFSQVVHHSSQESSVILVPRLLLLLLKKGRMRLQLGRLLWQLHAAAHASRRTAPLVLRPTLGMNQQLGLRLLDRPREKPSRRLHYHAVALAA
jgi:hypothetical protein